MASALYLVDELPLEMNGFVRVDDGDAGVIVLHAAPGVEPPDGAEVLMSGAASWTWGDFAALEPTLAAHCLPNEWAGESSAIDVTPEVFPRLAPPPEGL